MSTQAGALPGSSPREVHRTGRAALRQQLSVRLQQEHGVYLARLAVLLVAQRSARGVVTVSIERHATRYASEADLDHQQERQGLTRLLLRVCTDLHTAQGTPALPAPMGWLSEVVVLRRMVRALSSSEHLSHDEIAEVLGIGPDNVTVLLG